MSKMSHDRVEITVQSSYLRRSTIRACLEETMGIPKHKTCRMGEEEKDLKIRWRPSQFARFVILRFKKYGEPNNMSCLDMKLIPGEASDSFIDVSQNPNTNDWFET